MVSHVFAIDLETAAHPETIIGAVIHPSGYETEPNLPRDLLGTFLEWSVARPLLEYCYNPDFGTPDCHNVVAWTPSYVLFIAEYGGSVTIKRIPRLMPNEGGAVGCHLERPSI